MLDAMPLRKGWDKYESIMDNLKASIEESEYETDPSWDYYDDDYFDGWDDDRRE